MQRHSHAITATMSWRSLAAHVLWTCLASGSFFGTAGEVDYYLAQLLSDHCVAGTANCSLQRLPGGGRSSSPKKQAAASRMERDRRLDREEEDFDPLTMEPPWNYPKKFYCGAGRRIRKTQASDWRPARSGDASRRSAFVIAVGDWGATTCPHETWEQHMSTCVKYIIQERRRGTDWKQIYQKPGFLRCGSLHHLCTFQPGLWGTKQCDPSSWAWWKDSFAQSSVASEMGRVAERVSLDFVISTGDNFYLRGVMDDVDLNWRNMFEEVYQNESLHVPWLAVLGNHDYGGHECDSCLFEGGTGGCSGAQIGYDDEKTWEFPAPKRKRWVMPDRFYKKSFQYEDFSIDVFAIDSNGKNSHSLCHGQAMITLEKTCNTAQCERFHAELWQRQLSWLQEELPKSQATWKWVVAHHPCEMLGTPMLTLMASQGVSVIFAGHVHQLRLDRVGSIYCVVSGAGGGYQWNGGGHVSYTVQQGSKPEYGFVLVEVNKSKTILRFQNDAGQVLWEDVVLDHPTNGEIPPIQPEDAKVLADLEAEEDREMDTGLPGSSTTNTTSTESADGSSTTTTTKPDSEAAKPSGTDAVRTYLKVIFLVFVLVLVLVVAFVRRRRALRAARTTRPAAAHRSSRGVLVTWYCDQQQFFGFGVFVSCPEVL
ncbi:unnamed protein product [Durusdinium trenchii]|uniref:Calcineurin-like phosphoesterase domain-containing protein n=1 Tax=Durusdinium trenchii TaxID=1381693 RepID=A0ABP0NC16_9DINO